MPEAVISDTLHPVPQVTSKIRLQSPPSVWKIASADKEDWQLIGGHLSPEVCSEC